MSEELERVYEAVLAALREGRGGAIATVVEAGGSTPRGVGATMLILADGSTVGTIGGGGVEGRVIAEARAAIADGQARELTYRLLDEERGDPGVCGGDMRVFVQVLPARLTLLILGAGHVGQAVAEWGAFLGYRILVADERAEMLSAARFPQADKLLPGDLAETVAGVEPDEQTYVVMVTPHHTLDEKVLAVLAEHPVAYIGLIGSRRRTAMTFQRAREAGVPDQLLQRVHTPIGLDIGAETPREIALSIIAEIVAVQRGKL